MKTSNTLTIFITPVKGEEIRIEKACTLKQAVTLAKKEARKMISNGGMFVMINVIARASYGVETLAHIEAEKQGRHVAFSDEQPAETYAVCWGDEYKEEDGESNAIATTTSESDAKEIAESESESNGCVMSVVRKSDRKVIAIYNNTPETPNPDNTPTTMNANETTEFSELAHAGQCLDIYLNNTREIYERYTVPAIDMCAKAQSVKTPEMWDYIKQALRAAARLVIKYDGMTPTADDIKAVTANYVAYITECAEYQAANA